MRYGRREALRAWSNASNRITGCSFGGSSFLSTQSKRRLPLLLNFLQLFQTEKVCQVHDHHYLDSRLFYTHSFIANMRGGQRQVWDQSEQFP